MVAAAAATITLAVVAGIPATAVPDRSAGADAAPGGGGGARITLITGDRVLLDAKGEPVAVERATGRERIPIKVVRDGKRTTVVPLDAQRLVNAGKLDPRLFDLTELSKPQYRADHRDGLRLIVRYADADSPAKARLHAAGARPRGTLDSLAAEAVTTPVRDAAAVWQALTTPTGEAGVSGTSAGIEQVWLDGVRTPSLDRSTRQIGADRAWAAGFDGKGVKVAVLDTGVDATHPDLVGQVVAEKNFSQDDTLKDLVGHGTHVAGIVAGTGAGSGGRLKGVAPGAKLLNGKVLGADGGRDSDVLAGMEWAVAQGADVINMSLGGPDSPGLDPLELAVDRLSRTKGVLFAIAAGNEGRQGESTVGSPGSADAALTVGAVDDNGRLADFSSVGPRVGDEGVKPDVTAPGVNIKAPAAAGSEVAREPQNPPGYVDLSGTSMATPHVAGAAALLKQQHPGWQGRDLKAALTSSAKPGPYSPYQQGRGQISVENALKQTFVAEPAAVVFPVQLWPHADDKPAVRQLTYRNLGKTELTLSLKVDGTGPDGKPAPAGFFTLGARKVTIPAGGTKNVALTSDTRLGGRVDGRYLASVVATGGGLTSRTSAVVHREVESYQVTLKHLDRAGKATSAYDTVLVGMSGPAKGHTVLLGLGTGTGHRVPKGQYFVAGTITTPLSKDVDGTDQIVQPQLDVTKNTGVTLDARTARPVKITLPVAGAEPVSVTPGVTRTLGASHFSVDLLLDGFDNFRTAHLGPAVTDGTLYQSWRGHWLAGSTDEYHIATGSRVSRVATGYTKTFRAAELAHVKIRQGSPAPKKENELMVVGHLPGGDQGPALGVIVPERPRTVTLHLSTEAGAKWSFESNQFGGADLNHEAMYVLDPRGFRAGSSSTETFHTGVFGPLVDSRAGLFRTGDTLRPELPVLADGGGHPGISQLTRTTTVLYRDGVEVGRNKDPLTGESSFKLPAGAASYRLTTDVERSPLVSRVSTRVSASWTFRSARTSTKAALPVSVVRFTPNLDTDSTSPAGRTLQVPVTVQGAAAGANLRSLEVRVSYDDGKTWRKVSVVRGAVGITNPAKGSSVSLRGIVTDKQGNTSDVTIHRAYSTK
ncbi:S8 family serine peptidase [Streptomyces sp. NPDC058548]|uniref:S8 family peptidase n=1 Tax=unclassified Streptomyces TaxID=2593676 RepID=UPI003647E374